MSRKAPTNRSREQARRARKRWPVFLETLVLVDCRDLSDPDTPTADSTHRPFEPRVYDPGHLRCPGFLAHQKDSGRIYAVTTCTCPCHEPVKKVPKTPPER